MPQTSKRAALDNKSAFIEEATPVRDVLFRQVWETTSDALALSDSEGIVLAANPAYLRLYGYTQEQVVGQSFAIIFTPHQRPWAIEQYKAVFAGEESPATFESVVRRADGSERIVEASATFLEEAGRRTAMLSTIRDITQRKQAELALQTLNETLEERVQARTEQVKQLASQVLQAEQQVQARMAQVLHDELQQILFSAQMQVHLVEDELLAGAGTAVSASLTQLERNLTNGLEVVRRLTSDLSPQEVAGEDVLEMFKQLGVQMQRLFGLTVTVETEADAVPSIPDETVRRWLYQCVRELLFNVVKHAAVSRAHVGVGGSGERLQVTVTDAGTGFEPAAVLQATDRGGSESHGIGYVRDRVSWQGGELAISSHPGQGTRVTLTVPLDSA